MVVPNRKFVLFTVFLAILSPEVFTADLSIYKNRSTLTIEHSFDVNGTKSTIEFFSEMKNNIKEWLLNIQVNEVIESLQVNDIGNALEIFAGIENLDENSFSDQIVTKVFNKKEENLLVIAHFLGRLNETFNDLACRVFWEVFSEALLDEKLGKWQTGYFDVKVNEFMANKTCQKEKEMKMMIRVLKIVKNNRIDSWVAEIFKMNYEKVSQQVGKDPQMINELLESSLLHYFENVTHTTDSGLKFIQSIPSNETQAMATTSFLKSFLKVKGADNIEIFKIASFVKDLSEDFAAAECQGKDVYKRLIDTLPEAIRSIFLYPVCLFNNGTNMYMFIETIYDSLRRNVYTWRNGSRPLGAEWRFETKNRGETFNIRNVHHNEYMYMDSGISQYTINHHYVFTWRTKGNIPASSSNYYPNWSVKFYENGTKLSLKNTGYNSYIYSSDHNTDSFRKFVHSYASSSTLVSGAYWKIERCSDIKY